MNWNAGVVEATGIAALTDWPLSAALVEGPTYPTGDMPLEDWYSLRADSVREPKYPVVGTFRNPRVERMFWSAVTWEPVDPRARFKVKVGRIEDAIGNKGGLSDFKYAVVRGLGARMLARAEGEIEPPPPPEEILMLPPPELGQADVAKL